MSAQEALLEIANRIETRGHYQGNLQDLGCCLLSGTGDIPDRDEGLTLLRQNLSLEADSLSPTFFSLIEWNDSTPTPIVLETLRTVAAAQ